MLWKYGSVPGLKVAGPEVGHVGCGLEYGMISAASRDEVSKAGRCRSIEQLGWLPWGSVVFSLNTTRQTRSPEEGRTSGLTPIRP
jgi:hypothetical protein